MITISTFVKHFATAFNLVCNLTAVGNIFLSFQIIVRWQFGVAVVHWS